jgi:hypothetical protein
MFNSYVSLFQRAFSMGVLQFILDELSIKQDGNPWKSRNYYHGGLNRV